MIVVIATICSMLGTPEERCTEFQFEKNGPPITKEQCVAELPMAWAYISAQLHPGLTLKSAKCANTDDRDA